MDELIQHRAYELEPDTMTRTEHLIALLTPLCDDGGYGDPASLVADILAIADDRRLLNATELASRIGRPRTTIASWVQRGNLGPAVAYRVAGAPLWDAEVVEAWCTENPELCAGCV